MDIIKQNDEIVFARSIEKIANAHPYIIESAAIGVKNKNDSDEDIMLCAVLNEEKQISHEELYKYLVQNLAFYMVPRYIQLRQELPKSVNTQKQKFELKKQWERVEIKEKTWDAQIKNMIHIKNKNKLEVFE
jgi:crotonobetaine/carnitine-CoA ligase